MSWMIINDWHYQYMWYIVALTNIPTFLMEFWQRKFGHGCEALVAIGRFCFSFLLPFSSFGLAAHVLYVDRTKHWFTTVVVVFVIKREQY